MDKVKEYLDEIADYILNDCKKDEDFQRVCDDVHNLFKNNKVEDWQSKYYRESGAAKFLVNKTMGYMIEKGWLK